MGKRIMLTLDDDQYRILHSIKGLGTKDAEIARDIIIAYLSEKNYIKKASKIHAEKEQHLPENAPSYTG